MTNNQIITFAKTNFRNQETKFGIKTDDRRRHMYLLGKTGMGKSVTLENMIIQDIQNGRGVAVVDPHGELVEKIIKFIPTGRINDVIYVNPSDLEYPFAFNVLEQVSPEHRHLVASGLLGVFKKIWADSWGPRLEYVLNNAIMALLEYPGSTLLGIMRMLTDKTFRKKVISKITDPVIKAFWIEEYSKYPDRFQAEAIAPIQNKVGRFLSSSMMRNIVGQVKSSIDLRRIMDDKKILLLNLSKGRIGEDNSALLGAMIITKIQLAAMSRVEIPEAAREDFYLYVDEFQNFATESFANILSEARKYRLNLIMAHQYIEQLGDTTRAAVFGNVGTIISFRIGAEDAEFLAKEFSPRFDELDLVNLSKYQVYLKLMIDGVASEPFSATTLPPVAEPENWREILEKIINVSRERYATKRSIIEEKIIRWANMDKETTEQEIPESKVREQKNIRTNEPQTRVVANCDNCGNKTILNFEPDLNKPIYCKDCLKKKYPKPNKSASGLAEQVLRQKPVSLKDAMGSEIQNFKNYRKEN
ncbi:MAG TPA: type IV secretion system DNA-binding domain-containing protein [Patescibacteria group bacterium]|nr:type IV secretion system DNA-binding domain-containing protein [Patescibacteria group bacterium]